MAIDISRVEEFVGRVIGDVGTAMSGALVLIGDKLGLYRALADGGPASAAELAERTGTAERYVREWLAAQAAAGYVLYDPATEQFAMTEEQAMVLADEQSSVFMSAAFEPVAAMYQDEPMISEAFRSGRGVAWGDHSDCLFHGTERFFRVGYAAHLVDEWIPALEDVEEKLRRGAKVADIGCGRAASTILMAQAFPNSTFFGFDFHEPSIHRAREAAAEAGVEDRCTFEVADAESFPGRDYDLIACFDALHDMGHPLAVAKYIRRTLRPDGTWMLVEPAAGDSLEDNLNPVGRLFYSASTMFCVPNAISQDRGCALGAQAGERRFREIMAEAGFTRFRRATQTALNLILEARP